MPLSLDLQHAQLSVLARMRVRPFRYETMVLNQRKVECSLWVGDESFPEMQKFKDIGGLVMDDGIWSRRSINCLELHFQ